MKIAEIPLWSSCPFRDEIPAEFEIRLGVNGDGSRVLILHAPQDGLFVQLDKPVGEKFIFGSDIVRLLNQLGGAVFNKRHPGLLLEMFARKARAFERGEALPDQERWEELHKLSNPKLKALAA